MKVFCGIDTSCYTTSLAFIKEDGTLAADVRRGLVVKPGGQGLAQSEMVYQHTRNLPNLFVEAQNMVGTDYELVAISASTRPRPQPDSYMPAFLVGEGLGKILAMAQHIPYYPISHQENHILAGIWSAGNPSAGRFLAVHASGGTTEITLVTRTAAGFAINIIGGSKDIAAGQLIDRIGVALELPFPAGPELEKLAEQAQGEPIHIPLTIDGTWVSFSGPETHARRLLTKGCQSAGLAAGIQVCVAEALAESMLAAVRATGVTEILLVGGVGANGFIRQYVVHKLSKQPGVRVYFPDNKYIGDNGVGAAYFAYCGSNVNEQLDG